MTTPNVTTIQAAVEFAVRCHAGQYRKSNGLPFIVHPMEVLKTVGGWGVSDPNVWCAALCHDVLEDCPVGRDEVAAVIGPVATQIVEELTFKPSGSRHFHGSEKEKYIESFGDKSVEALVIKCADRICNTADFSSTDRPYAKKYWAKGAPLFEIMVVRKAEIIARFGDSALTEMKYAHDLVARIVK